MLTVTASTSARCILTINSLFVSSTSALNISMCAILVSCTRVVMVT